MTTRNLYLIALTSLFVSIITTIIYGTYGPIRAVAGVQLSNPLIHWKKGGGK